MAGRTKEVTVVVLDVGPQMSNNLVHVRKSLFLFSESKLLHAPSHEVAFVLYGTTETNNEVNKEMAEQGDPEQYKHINVIQPIICTSLATLQMLNSLSCGRGFSDHVNALLVGLDLLKKALKARPQLSGAKARRRLMLLGSFDTEVDPLDVDSREHLVRELASMDTSLEVYCVGGGAAARSPEAEACRDSNLSGLHELLAQVAGSYKDLPGPVDMAAMFPVGGVSSVGGLFPFRIGSDCTIEVQVFKKTDSKKPPSLKAYNPNAGSGMTGYIKLETEFRDPSNPDEPLANEEKVKAFRYGQQLVPIPDEATAQLMRYSPGKCLDLIGFTDRANIPRWQFASECWVALACQREKPVEHAVALSALVQGLKQNNRAAVIRYCRTDSADAMLMAGLPLLAPSTALGQLDGLLLVKLPFKDDLRQMAFRTFNDPAKQNLYPTVQQTHLMRKLVQSLRLAPATTAASAAGSSQVDDVPGWQKEQLVPDDTLNPMIQRFYWFMGQRAIDPQFQVPDSQGDLLAAAVLDQQPRDQLPKAAQEVLQALAEVFPITAPVQAAAAAATGTQGGTAAAGGEAAAAAGAIAADEGGVRWVGEVSTATPVEDFKVLLDRGLLDQAFTGLQAAITTLVDESTGTRFYNKAVTALQALRAAAVEQKQPARFNSFLDVLRDKYKAHPGKSDFWMQLMSSAVAPISNDEVPAAGLSKAAAEEYVRVHSQAEKPAAEKVEMVENDEEEDEFAGLD